jgi:queuine tRNA-ribosyltransferase
MTEVSTLELPKGKPRYLMGAGTPIDIIESVARGVDLFDCVLPTRNARNGTLFTNQGKLSIKNARFADDEAPLDSNCSCYTCTNFSRAYLRHLFMAREMSAATLHTIHNLSFYLQMMAQIRSAIEKNRFGAYRSAALERLSTAST